MVDPARPPAKDAPPTPAPEAGPAAIPVVAERGAPPPPTGVLGFLVRHQAIVVPLVAVVLAFALSGIGSYFLLNRQREAFARRVEERAQRLTARYDEMKTREDAD